jgi:signal transduction histidine kinase
MKLGARLQLMAASVAIGTTAAIAIYDEALAWEDVVLPGAIATLIALGVATITAAILARRIRDLRDVTRSLAEGDLSARPPLTAPGELGELATAIHRLSEHLGSRLTELNSEDALLVALIESLDEGVIAIDARRQVVRINAAARGILGLRRALPFNIDALPRIPELQRAIDGALRGTSTEPSEVSIAERIVSLTARPLAMGGVVIAMFDLTRVRRLEAVRRDFVANVSHELRTPLTVISGFSETLADDDVPPEMRRQFASTIHAHTERMQRIVDDLLDLSRLESGKWQASVSDVNTEEIVDEIVATFGEAARKKGLSLQFRPEPGASHIRADRTAIRQVLSNLTDNAVRHTESGGVTIFARPGDGGVWIGVSDTGPGIPPQHLPRIFERFYRVDSDRGRHTGGTGLGLAIVKHLVDAHGGKLETSSEPGMGTTISAFFPSSPPRIVNSAL